MMKRLTLRVISLLFIFLLAGCDGNGADDEPDAVLLRIDNVSSIDFSSVLVSFPGAEARYDAVASGQASEYRELEAAYSYGYVEVKTEGETYRIQPIDYVGEKPLENGRYTYELNIEESNLKLEFERD